MEDEQPKLYLMYDESLPVEPVVQRILLRSMTILCDMDAPGVTARIRRFHERRWTFGFSDRTLLLRRSHKKTDKKPKAFSKWAAGHFFWTEEGREQEMKDHVQALDAEAKDNVEKRKKKKDDAEERKARRTWIDRRPGTLVGRRRTRMP